MSTPSAWKLEEAMAAFEGARHRDALESDDDTLARLIEEKASVENILRATIRASLEADAMAAAAKARMENLAARRKRFEARRDQCRATAFAVMDILGERKIVEPDFTVSIGKPRESLIVTDEDQIPDEYWKTERVLDKAKLNDDVLKHGLEITGAERANGIPSLTIRSK